MSKPQRTTVYLDQKLHRALRYRAAETDASISELVSDALRASFAEELEDIRDVRKRGREPKRGFEAFVSELERKGEL